MAVTLEAASSPSSAVTAIQFAPHSGQAAGEDKGSRATLSESACAATPDCAVLVNEKLSFRCSISIEMRWVRFTASPRAGGVPQPAARKQYLVVHFRGCIFGQERA